MTFDEWWDKEGAELYYTYGRCGHKLMGRATWEAAQPKWTYCKDGMPTEDGNYLVAVLLPYGRRTVLSSDYDANNCDFWEIDPDREIIAWMPLPEAPNVHND